MTVTPPKWLREDPATLAAAYRHGIAEAIWMRERRIVPSFRAYVIGGRAFLRFADRVRIEWMRRHPRSTDSEPTS